MEIKVLGTGCLSCKTLYETTQQAIAELGSDATLVKDCLLYTSDAADD